MAQVRILLRADNGQLVRVGPGIAIGTGEVWPHFVSLLVEADEDELRERANAVLAVWLRAYFDFDLLSSDEAVELSGSDEATVSENTVVFSERPGGLARMAELTKYRDKERWAFVDFAYVRSCHEGQTTTPDLMDKIGKPERKAELAESLERANSILKEIKDELEAVWLAEKEAATKKRSEIAEAARVAERLARRG